MISGEDLYAIWAPDGAQWTEWAKPASFLLPVMPDAEPMPGADNVPGLPEAWADTAVVADLPGAEAVHVGMALAKRGYRPVPLFNATFGPNAVIDVDVITRALVSHAETLRRVVIAPDALPVFLLDSRRRHNTMGAATPGWYDNRWVALPQDFPSGTLLRSRGIADVTLLLRDESGPSEDLAHVLLRWQKAGLRVRVVDLATGRIEDNVQVREPSFFRRAWYVAIAVFGLRRSNVGGFGAMVPEQTSRGGFYG
jgi:hypothetical protein